jgi:hypothetical protein
MATNTADAVSAARTGRADSGNDKPTTRTRRARANADEENNDCARYFLAKANSDGGTPALDREVASEGEALVEALRLGVTYYAIQEFRVIPDFAGKRPQLNKEAVHGK